MIGGAGPLQEQRSCNQVGTEDRKVGRLDPSPKAERDEGRLSRNPGGHFDVPRGPSELPPDSPELPDFYVRDECVRDIVTRLGACPEVDVFGSAGQQRFARWWGRGDLRRWIPFSRIGVRRCLRLQTPFTKVGEVMKKLRENKGHAILAVLEWKSKT